MKYCILLLLLVINSIVYSQDQKPKASFKKGSFYFYWGWNRDLYTPSDITFTGSDYDFTLENVIAKDRQSPFEFEVYLNPNKITIPQYNARIGYYINDKYQVSIGADHMKYVVQNDRTSTITGHIANSGTVYDGNYEDSPILLTKDFLMFEHTDGLNYFNVEFRRSDKIWEKGIFTVNVSEGFGAGPLIPRTNTTLMGNPRYDQFHISGFGAAILGAINVEIYDRFFLQTELKAGFINMPDIRTTMFEADRAKQHFSFLQSNIVLGVNLNTGKRKLQKSTE